MLSLDFLKFKADEFTEIYETGIAFAYLFSVEGPVTTKFYDEMLPKVGEVRMRKFQTQCARTEIGWVAVEFWHWLTHWDEAYYNKIVDVKSPVVDLIP